jgi:hypothetical protein
MMLEKLFQQVVQLSQKLGMLSLELVARDGKKVKQALEKREAIGAAEITSEANDKKQMLPMLKEVEETVGGKA